MEKQRVYTINEPAIVAILANGGTAVKNIWHEDEIKEAAEHGSVIVINPSADIQTGTDNPIYPQVFMEWYHSLMQSILIKRQRPPFKRRPWRPATFFECDPHQETGWSARLNRFSHSQKEDGDELKDNLYKHMYRSRMRPGKLVQAVRHALAHNLRVERHARNTGNNFIIKDIPLEPYITHILREARRIAHRKRKT